MHSKYIVNSQYVALSIFQWDSWLLRVSNPHLYVNLQVEAWNLSHNTNLIFVEWLPKEGGETKSYFLPSTVIDPGIGIEPNFIHRFWSYFFYYYYDQR